MAEIRTIATDREKQDLQITIAQTINAVVAQDNLDMYIEVGPERREATLCFGDEPGTGEMLSNQFECIVPGDNRSDRNAEYEEWEDVLVVTVQHVRRRAIES